MSIEMKHRAPELSEYPDIELYMDQVLTVLEQKLSPFFPGEKSITSTMINNYVKQKLILPPESKRYGKVQMTRLFMICILKSVLQLSEISALMSNLEQRKDFQELYALFAEKFDSALDAVFSGKAIPTAKEDPTEFALSSALMAFCHILRSRMAFSAAEKNWLPIETQEEKKEKKEKKEKEKKNKEKK